MIALLDEPSVILKEFALAKLNEIVDEFWPEIADSVEKMWVDFHLVYLLVTS